MQAKVFIGGEFREVLEVASGHQQGCILAPVYSFYFPFVLCKVNQSMLDFGTDLHHELDGNLFNLSPEVRVGQNNKT